MRLIIDIPEDDYELVQKYIYPQRVFYELVHGTPIPDNATNGDVINAMFPNTSIHYHKADEIVDDYVSVNIMGCDTQQDYSAEWWDAPYRAGREG